MFIFLLFSHPLLSFEGNSVPIIALQVLLPVSFWILMFPACVLFQVCFAYKGPFENRVQFLVNYYDTENVKRSYYPIYKFIRGDDLTKWNWACINLLQKLEEYLTESRAKRSRGFWVQYILMRSDGQRDMFVDDIWIGKQDITGKPFFCSLKKLCNDFNFHIVTSPFLSGSIPS